jgi:ankyrin repeat protein
MKKKNLRTTLWVCATGLIILVVCVAVNWVRHDRGIWFAVEVGYVDYLKTWLANGGNPNLTSPKGRPLLYVAAECPKASDEKSVLLLLSYGANPNSSYDGNCVLGLAAGNGSFGGDGDSGRDIVALLRCGADPNGKAYGECALVLAAKLRCRKAVEALVKAGADMSCTYRNGKSVTEILLEKYPGQEGREWVESLSHLRGEQ